MPALTPSTIALLVLLPLIVWRVAARFRRSVGRQHFSKGRIRITLLLYPVVLLLLTSAALNYPGRVWTLAAGLGIGILVALCGLRMTSFETAAEGMFYTPNAHLGIVVSLLFVGRVLYRLVEVYSVKPGRDVANFAQSPVTLVTFGLLAGYYIAYAIGLLRMKVRLGATAAETPASEPGG